MRSALYYPHTRIQTEQLLKRALLLWDYIYVITPWQGYQPYYELPRFAEAFSIIGRCHYPSDDEKQLVHGLVADFLDRPLPAAFSYSPANDDQETYDIYPQKLLPDTVTMLEQRGMSLPLGRRNMRASAATGLTLMNILADCCAGDTLARVTDEGHAYANLAGLFVEDPDGDLTLDQAREQLIPLSINVVNVDGFSLEALIGLRAREEAAAEGSQIRDLRHRFVEKIENQAKHLVKAGSSLAREAIEQEFRRDMQDDYRDLQDALRAKGVQTIGTKEVLGATLFGLGAIATAIFAPPVAIAGAASAVEGIISVGGLISAKSKWAEERKKILKEHPTAYLYEADGGVQW